MLRAYYEVCYGVDVKENYVCLSEDSSWFVKMICIHNILNIKNKGTTISYNEKERGNMCCG